MNIHAYIWHTQVLKRQSPSSACCKKISWAPFIRRYKHIYKYAYTYIHIRTLHIYIFAHYTHILYAQELKRQSPTSTSCKKSTWAPSTTTTRRRQKTMAKPHQQKRRGLGWRGSQEDDFCLRDIVALVRYTTRVQPVGFGVIFPFSNVNRWSCCLGLFVSSFISLKKDPRDCVKWNVCTHRYLHFCMYR